MQKAFQQAGFDISSGNQASISIIAPQPPYCKQSDFQHFRGFLTGQPGAGTATVTATISFGDYSITLPTLTLDPDIGTQQVIPFEGFSNPATHQQALGTPPSFPTEAAAPTASTVITGTNGFYIFTTEQTD